MRSLLRCTAAGALCLGLGLGMGLGCATASAAAQARVVSSTWLPGGKYALVYEFEGAEYMALSADPPGAWVAVSQPEAMAPAAPQTAPSTAPSAAPPTAPMVSHADPFPTSSSYVGGFFIDPLSAALRASGLGLLLSGNWPHGPRRFER
ncbi:hypothetical protein VLK31_25840 [Variovorax sp. H27-G14]|uniref:hypothetical protein n=1 Tax=Variovorax sp. H27-G14 TaxID=3111914 RepID=UPI0038FD02C6